MNDKSLTPELEAELKKLEERVGALLALCQKLQEENQIMKVKQRELLRERGQLIEKTTLARNRVEAMIDRLKSLGHGI